jgi:hypothetical protein
MYRIKETPRESFRWAAHTGGLAVVKTKDYDFFSEIEATSPYSAWKNLAAEGNPIRPGDVLEELLPSEGVSKLYIAKYIGFEPAEWFVPEPKSEACISVLNSTESVTFDSESHL